MSSSKDAGAGRCRTGAKHTKRVSEGRRRAPAPAERRGERCGSGVVAQGCRVGWLAGRQAAPAGRLTSGLATRRARKQAGQAARRRRPHRHRERARHRDGGLGGASAARWLAGSRRSPSCGRDRSSAADCAPCGCGAASSGGPGHSSSCRCPSRKSSRRGSCRSAQTWPSST